ncbi:MAG: hypothetical protein DI536_20030 [Archangium gephyra]|uniref:Lipoprotein n=1 Tax=Archangium gephyra TaxID=48 RepID=A0A2W5T679_9BACT|nr:MAG: hypothetical protein DI536_20030 [Archangium gephyra]
MRNMNVVMASLCVVLSGCSWLSGGSAGTGRLTVSPTNACPGSPITVTWSGAQPGATVVGPTGVIGSGASGTATFIASSDGTVELRSATTRRESFFVRSNMRFTVPMFQGTCGPLVALGGLSGIGGAGVVGTEVADSRFVATAVSASRLGFIGHLGNTALYDGRAVPISGPVTGTWEFAVPLLDWESCFGPNYPPGAVTAFVDATCR